MNPIFIDLLFQIQSRFKLTNIIRYYSLTFSLQTEQTAFFCILNFLLLQTIT